MAMSNRRAMDKFTKQLNRNLQRSAKKNIKPIPIPADSPSVSVAGQGPVTIQNVYGDTVNVYGDDNNVAVGASGDVAQAHRDEPVDVSALRNAVRDLLASTIDFDDDVHAEVHANAEALQAEADQDQPDHGKLRHLSASIGNRLRGIPTSAVGGFLAQGLAAAFLPPS